MKKRASARPKKRASARSKKSAAASKKRGPVQSGGTDASWLSKPASAVWNTGSNWSSGKVPAGAATFGASSRSDITFNAGSASTVDSLEFAAGAAAYTLEFTDTSPQNPTLTIAGAGVSNESSNTQVLTVAAFAASRNTPQLAFTNSANAGGSNMQYNAGPAGAAGQGGGVIRFFDTSSAGSASFKVTTGSGTPPKVNSTVGGEVTFSETATADSATFDIYGSTSTTDGDTFGNVVFHDSATAAQASFTNQGATEPKGDGGNTQFYDTSTAANGVFHNFGATVANGNGGDVAFDGTATAANGQYYNYASTASGGYGGVTSFNNNAPNMASKQGSSAGQGHFYNYGAEAAGQLGGHTYFTAKYGSPTAANGIFFNCGSALAPSGTSANSGRTVFSISIPQKPGQTYTPDAGEGTFVNLPGTTSGSLGGITEFTVFSDPPSKYDGSPAKGKSASVGGKAVKKSKASAVTSTGPSAANARIFNLGGTVAGANGGQTIFSGYDGVVCTAGHAQITAMGGSNGGNGGSIVFKSDSSGGSATIGLSGNGTLDVSQAGGSVTIGGLNLNGGIIVSTLGSDTTEVVVDGNVNIRAAVQFRFVAGSGFDSNGTYTILTGTNLSGTQTSLFSGNDINQMSPTFTVVGNSLQVSFGSSSKAGRPRSRTRAR